MTRQPRLIHRGIRHQYRHLGSASREQRSSPRKKRNAIRQLIRTWGDGPDEAAQRIRQITMIDYRLATAAVRYAQR